MSEPIWDRRGAVVGWLDGEHVRTLSGRAEAFLHGDSVISYRGHGHLGWFVNHVFRDSRGHAVAFIDGASGISLPGRSGVPGRPGFGGIPGRSIPGIPGRPGFGGWGDTSFDDFLSGAPT
jgi:hypothetical protein